MKKLVTLVAFVVALVGVCGSVGACSSSSSGSGCVDFVIGDDDRACAVDADCSFVDSTHVCPQDPSCSGEIAVNKAAVARYQKETSGVPRQQVACGAPAPVKCVAKKCTL